MKYVALFIAILFSVWYLVGIGFNLVSYIFGKPSLTQGGTLFIDSIIAVASWVWFYSIVQA